MGGVDPGVVVHVCAGLEQRVDQLIVALSESHLQTVDGVLVHHGPGVQQQTAALQVVVGHGEKERRPALVVVVAAHPWVKHEVWVVAGSQQRLHTMGMPAGGCRMEGAHPTFLDGAELGHRDELLQSPVRRKNPHSPTRPCFQLSTHTRVEKMDFGERVLTVCGHGRPSGGWAGARCK